MTFAKMLRVLEEIERLNGYLPSGSIGVSAGGELRFEFRSQPTKNVNDYLIRKGFVPVDGDYIYRPL